MDQRTRANLIEWSEEYNDIKYFTEDPIAFPRKFAESFREGKASLQDVEISALFAAHFAWGRRAMIVRDCGRLFDEMCWQPYNYVMSGDWRDEDASIHRTIKWSEVAAICSRLRDFYNGATGEGISEADSSSMKGTEAISNCESLSAAKAAETKVRSIETLDQDQMRTLIFGQKSDLKAPNKKINMMRRWMVRNDGKVDLGLWKHSDPADLLIPLDVHVWDTATMLGLTNRSQKDITTVREITGAFDEIFPGDPCKGDFALFGYGVTHQ